MCQNKLLTYDKNTRVAIVGRAKDTVNYENALKTMGISSLTTMDLGHLSDFNALLLPGGGDITPAFFGQKNQGSKNIDIELDITQLQALDIFVKWKRPVLGICKGIQIINVYFGGTIIQHLPQAAIHAWDHADKVHLSSALPGTPLYSLYGEQFIVNSAHHQGIDALGKDLCIIQTSEDGIIEGLLHTSLPVIGVQWHPERLFRFPSPACTVDGSLLFSYFLTLCSLERP